MRIRIICIISFFVSSLNGIDAQDTTDVTRLPEVVVYNQTKESFVPREMALSSTLMSGNQIASLHSGDLRQLSAFVPSFTMPEYGARYTSSMYMRGTGSRIGASAVAMTVDGMPVVNKSALNTHLFDVSAVNLLRGPQGTLYGQSAEAGLLQIFTRNPLYNKGTDVKVGVGNHGYREAEMSHVFRLANVTALSLSAFYTGTDGFFRNVTTGKRADKGNEYGGRLRLVSHPGNTLIDFHTDIQRTMQNAFAYAPIETSEVETNRMGQYSRTLFNSSLLLQQRFSGFNLSSQTSFQHLHDNMMMDMDYLSSDFMHFQQRQQQMALTEEIVARSNGVGAWKWSTGAFLSQEWLKTTAPVFFDEGMTSMLGNSIQSQIYNAMVASMSARFIQQGMAPEMARAMAENVIAKAGGVTVDDVDMGVPGVFRTPQLNVAFFHESDIKLADRLLITLGIRYDYLRHKIMYDTSASMALTASVMGTTATNTLLSAITNSHVSHSHELLPKMGLTYSLNDNGSNVYASFGKGYRSGGYNIQMFSDILQTELMANRTKVSGGDYVVEHTPEDYENIRKTIEYKPEETLNLEVGSHLNLLSNMLRIDLSAYHMVVRNQQLSVMAGNYGFGRMMVNAGRSRSMGFEVAANGKALRDNLFWTISYGFVDSRFRDYNDAISVGGVEQTVSYKNKKVPYVPQNTLAVIADYTIKVKASWLDNIVVGTNLTAQGRTYWDVDNTYSQPFYALLGAHVDFQKSNMILSFWTKNITSTSYNTFAISSGASMTERTFAQKGNPFQCGVQLKCHF